MYDKESASADAWCMCVRAGSAADRKISFAVFGANERSDSLHSSTTSITQMDAAATDGKGRCTEFF